MRSSGSINADRTGLVSGRNHVDRVAADARKDRHLGRAGYRVLRIPAGLVMRDVAAAVELLRAALSAR